MHSKGSSSQESRRREESCGSLEVRQRNKVRTRGKESRRTGSEKMKIFKQKNRQTLEDSAVFCLIRHPLISLHESLKNAKTTLRYIIASFFVSCNDAPFHVSTLFLSHSICRLD